MNEAVEILPPQAADIVLAEHAAVIRALGKRVVGDIIEIGRRLAECKNRLGHGNWLPWIDQEFGWSEDTAENYMRVADDKFRTIRNLELPLKGLYMLTAPSTPDEAREQEGTSQSRGRGYVAGPTQHTHHDQDDHQR